jgi:hypothetical protein
VRSVKRVFGFAKRPNNLLNHARFARWTAQGYASGCRLASTLGNLMETLFHYTDLNAFLSIVQNRKLRLTGAYNLNDYQEITWTLDKIRKRLTELAAVHGRQRPDEIWTLLHANSGVPYICSLSSEPDLLSQWRAYAQNGSGIAIGFNRKSLPGSNHLPVLTLGKDDSLTLHQVVYDEKAQELLIDSILKPAFEGKEIDDKAHHAMSMAATYLSALSSTFKNAAFHEEKEWRIIHRPFITGKENSNESKIQASVSPPKYRVSGGRLITYFEYDFCGAKPEDIFSKIVLGPKCEVSYYDLSILLTENGLANINVQRSKASYR